MHMNDLVRPEDHKGLGDCSDDTIASSNKDPIVTVRLGRPVLWGRQSGDTLLDGGRLTAQFDLLRPRKPRLDTNGNIRKY